MSENKREEVTIMDRRFGYFLAPNRMKNCAQVLTANASHSTAAGGSLPSPFLCKVMRIGSTAKKAQLLRNTFYEKN